MRVYLDVVLFPCLPVDAQHLTSESFAEQVSRGVFR
ncbi:hypothetical protein LQK93_03476 [Terrabacter sp. BE26]